MLSLKNRRTAQIQWTGKIADIFCWERLQGYIKRAFRQVGLKNCGYFAIYHIRQKCELIPLENNSQYCLLKSIYLYVYI